MTTTLEDLFSLRLRLNGHRGEVQCVHASGSSLVSGGADASVRLWDLAAGRAARALLAPAADGTEGGVTAVCCGAADGPAANWIYAAVATHVYGWDLRAPGMIVREPACAFNNLASDEIGHIALHEMSGALAAADDAGDVHIVDVGSMAAAPGATSGAIVALRGGHSSICSWVAFRPGVQTCECCTAGLDALCVRWDWRIAAKLGAWALAAPSGPFAAALAGEAAAALGGEVAGGGSSSGGGAGSSSSGGGAAAEQPPAQLLNPRHAHCVSYAPDGGCFAVALGDGSVEVRLAESGEPICAVDAHRAACSQAHFAPQLSPALALRTDGDEDEDVAAIAARGLPLLSAGDDRQVRLWSVEGIAGRGGPQGGGGGKRQRRGQAAAECDDADEDDDEADFGEPGFREIASVRLGHKPNGIAAASDPAGGGRALVCVATTGEAIEVLAV